MRTPGHPRRVFTLERPVSEAARYIGPIGAGLVAKLVHNCAGYGIQMVLADVFSMGIKAGGRAACAMGGSAYRRQAWSVY